MLSVRNHTILVVDDEKEMCASLKTLLEKNGFNVIIAESGSSALEILQTKPISLVLSDIRMPEMSGLEFMEKVLSLLSNIPFIFMTAYASVETAVKALRMGAADYVVKPFKINELIIVIREHLPKLPDENFSPHFKEDLSQFLSSSSTAMKHVFYLAKRFANTDMPVLIQGASGTGKELLAEYIHSLSNRKSHQFIKINCANLSENILESELFGHERGAYTGAQYFRRGKFELANRGTLFLDEIGDMSINIQAKLLRVLQEGEFYRLGGDEPIKVDVRIIAATHKDVYEMVNQGVLREDFFYRLEGTILHLPPLIERKEDIPSLIEFFLRRYSKKYGKPLMRVSKEVLELFNSYHWPGNVRELKNCLERCVVVCDDEIIVLSCVQGRIRNMKPANAKLDGCNGQVEMGRAKIINALYRTGGSRTKAASLLKISRKTLYNKMKELKIVWPPEQITR